MIEPKAVLDFWFCERARALWFEKDAAFDAEIRARFGAAVEHAQAGGFEEWRRNEQDTLALLILLDQMPRNIHRGSPLAFAGDARALEVAEAAIAAGFDCRFGFDMRRFFYLPHEHCEDLAIQERSLELFGALARSCRPEERADAEDQLDYAQRHAVIIRRFGRYPHRNAALSRDCTPEELEFLAGPGSSF